MGLLHLDKAIKFNFYVRPACVNVDRSLEDSAVISASEWDRQQQNVQIVDHESCNKHFTMREMLESEQVCVKLRNNCLFPTGSALQMRHPQVEEMELIVGLLTFRKDCLKGESIVAFTRISQFAAWIEEIAFK